MHAQRSDVIHRLAKANYFQRWLLMLNSAVNRTIAKAIFDDIHAYSADDSVLPSSAVVSEDLARDANASFRGSSRRISSRN